MARVLGDHEINLVPFKIVLEAVRAHILSDFQKETISPPRHVVEFGDGGLVFTIGGTPQFAGFRAYETFRKPALEAEDQLTAVWDRKTRLLSGLAIGERLGALRTGALGGVAIDRMASKNVRKLAVVGTGVQAETQMIAACAVRSFDEIVIYSRAMENREVFASRMNALLKREVRPGDNVKSAVNDADIIILATDSSTPVFDSDWLKAGAHINTLGPKRRSAHELPLEIADMASLIASDSPQQIAAMGADHMLSGLPAAQRILHVGDPAVLDQARNGFSVYLSAGLAGSEVAALAAILSYVESRST